MAGIAIEGYNIYRNREKLNTTPVASTYFNDNNPLPGDYNYYHVTVVYDRGESAPSNRALVGTSAIDNTTGTTPTIWGGTGCVVVENATGLPVHVVSPDGRTIAATTGTQHTRIPLAPGVYMVKAGPTTAKTIVR